MKKFLSLLFVLVCAFVLVGCGEDKYEIAMITDFGDITDQSFNQTTWEAVQSYAKDNEKTFAYYKPAGDSTAERVAKIEQAIKQGAKVVVMPGFAFAGAIYEVQDEYKDVKFIALDVSEYDVTSCFYKKDSNGNATEELIDANNKPHIGDNVVCIVFQEEEAGYLAGYAAVKNGETKLGFLGGMAVPAVVRYGYGYAQGIKDAAKELDVDVELWYAYGGQFFGDATITAVMEQWLTDGCDTIFACGGGIFSSVVSAIKSKKTSAKLIGVDSDQSLTIKDVTVMTSAMKGLTDATKTCLDEFYGSWTVGGKVLTYGLKTDTTKEYVGLPRATWTMTTYKVDDYSATIADIRSGKVTVNNDISVNLEKVLEGSKVTIKANVGSIK